MSSTLKEKLRKQISAIFRGSDYSQIEKFLLNYRKIIEIDGALQSRFPTLRFYSDWISHSQIDRQSYRFLERRIACITYQHSWWCEFLAMFKYLSFHGVDANWPTGLPNESLKQWRIQGRSATRRND